MEIFYLTKSYPAEEKSEEQGAESKEQGAKGRTGDGANWRKRARRR
jgi:hypothetical protein